MWGGSKVNMVNKTWTKHAMFQVCKGLFIDKKIKMYLNNLRGENIFKKSQKATKPWDRGVGESQKCAWFFTPSISCLKCTHLFFF